MERVADERIVQFEKQYAPIEFTEFGITIDLSELHDSKQDFPNKINVFGIVTDLRLEKSLKHSSPRILILLETV